MNFKFTKKVDGKVPAYGGHMVKTGDIISLDGHLAEKAANNPLFEMTDAKATVKPKAKKPADQEDE